MEKRWSLKRKEYMLCSKLVTSTTEVTWGSKIQIILSKKIFSSQYDLNTLFMLTESSYYIIKALSFNQEEAALQDQAEAEIWGYPSHSSLFYSCSSQVFFLDPYRWWIVCFVITLCVEESILIQKHSLKSTNHLS